MTKKETIKKKIEKAGYAILTEEEKEIYDAKDMRLFILEFAKKCLGKDISEKENELGCAESVNFIGKEVTGEEFGGGTSTKLMYKSLISKDRFKKVIVPLPGDIIISPTGYSSDKNTKIKNGHVGIFLDSGRIASNNSETFKFDDRFLLSEWIKYFKKTGKYPVEYFKILS